MLWIFVLLLAAACVYDPPRKGKELRFLNQTNTGIYIFIDSLDVRNDHIHYLDTMQLNGRSYIVNKASHLTPFGEWSGFIADDLIEAVRKRGQSTIAFYVLKDSDIGKPVGSLFSQKQVHKVTFPHQQLEYPSIKTTSINILTYYGDSSVFSHRYDLQY